MRRSAHGRRARLCVRPLRARRLPRRHARLFQRTRGLPVSGGPRARAVRRRHRAAGRPGLRRLARRHDAAVRRRPALGLRAVRGRRLRRADRPSGDGRAVRPRAVHGRRRAPRHRGLGAPRRGPAAARGRPRARVPVAGRALRRCAVSPLPLRGRRRGRRLRRARAPVEHEPRLPPRRAAARGRGRHRRRLPQLPRPREPRVLPRVERQADQAGGLRALRPRARELHAAAVGVRGPDVVLRRPGARALRPRSARALPGAPWPHDHDGAAHARPARAERRRVVVRRVDQVLPAGREHAERGRQLLREGRARRLRARPRAAPRRARHARRPDARAVGALRAPRRRRARGRHRRARERARRARHGGLLRALRRRHRGPAAARTARRLRRRVPPAPRR